MPAIKDYIVTTVNPFPFSPACRAIGAILALLLARAGAEPVTTVIRPSVAYTVKNLVNGVYQDKQPRLYANGYSGQPDSAEAWARMEFQIPLLVLIGLKTIEFRAQQNGVSPTDTGYSYLWFYGGNVGETTQDLNYARDGFTAEGIETDGVFSRNLLKGFSGSPSSLPVEKFGLMITTHLNTSKEVTFEDPQLVITYEPQPPDNGAAVNVLLTSDARKPFAGQTDPAVVGFDADPDQDGHPNFYELWRGSYPDNGSRPGAPNFGKTGTGLPYIQVRVDKYADARLLIRAEASHNLIDWRDISATRITQTSGSITYARFNDVIPPVGSQPCYFRFVALPEDEKYE